MSDSLKHRFDIAGINIEATKQQYVAFLRVYRSFPGLPAAVVIVQTTENAIIVVERPILSQNRSQAPFAWHWTYAFRKQQRSGPRTERGESPSTRS